MHRQFRIHPAIGIARVGNSEEYFIGPEEPGTVPLGSGPYKENGRIKRQAARFRVFEYIYDDSGRLQSVQEVLSSPNVAIEWRVQLANKKAAAPMFQNSNELRNPGIHLDDLIIDGGMQKISGPNQKREVGGYFLNIPVILGELRTDDAGRLIVVGAYGKSFSVPNGLNLPHFADNPRWCDDVADGPVMASILYASGEVVEVEDSAWIIIAPPDFAPGITNVVTLYDVVLDVAVQFQDLAVQLDPEFLPDRPVSFTRDIYPILQRTVNLSWVEPRAEKGHSRRNPEGYFLDPKLLANLADDKDTTGSARHVFNRLRAPAKPNSDGDMPDLYGGLNPIDPSKKIYFTLTRLQYDRMEKWSKGNFEVDWNQTLPPDPDPAAVAKALDRAALEPGIGGPFYPGIEVGYIIAQPNTYDKPFRISKRFSAGDLTAGNAVPWQADFIECGHKYWPAQRPVAIQLANTMANTTTWLEWVAHQEWVDDQEEVDQHEWECRHIWMVNNWQRLGFVVQDGEDQDGEARFGQKERDPAL